MRLGDLDKAEAVLRNIADRLKENGDEDLLWASAYTAADVIKRQPSVDAALVRHGRWVPVYESEISGWNPEYAGYDPIGDYRCSLCGRDATLDCNNEFVLSPYCPNCGAKMEGSKEDA